MPHVWRVRARTKGMPSTVMCVGIVATGLRPAVRAERQPVARCKLQRQRLAYHSVVHWKAWVRPPEPCLPRASVRQEAEHQEDRRQPPYSGPEVADEARAFRFAGSRKSDLACW